MTWIVTELNCGILENMWLFKTYADAFYKQTELIFASYKNYHKYEEALDDSQADPCYEIWEKEEVE